MKRHAFTFFQALFVIAFLAIAAAVLFPVFGRSRSGNGGCEYRSSCSSNLKNISLAFAQYAQDYDEKFPPIRSGQSGWSQTLLPYIKSELVFQCPTEPTPAVAGQFTSDYFYNARLAKLSIQSVATPDRTLLSSDATGNSPADANLRQFPVDWKSNPSFPARRHKLGAPYAFADGHVKTFPLRDVGRNVTF